MKLLTSTFAVIFLIAANATPAQAGQMSYGDFVAQIQWLESQAKDLHQQVTALPTTTAKDDANVLGAQISTDPFTVSVDDTVVMSGSADIANWEARLICTEFAFNPEYMWQTVRCDYQGETIYEDVFVAG